MGFYAIIYMLSPNNDKLRNIFEYDHIMNILMSEYVEKNVYMQISQYGSYFL